MIKATQTYFDLKLLVFLCEMLVFWEKIIKLLTFLGVGDCLFFLLFLYTHVGEGGGILLFGCFVISLSHFIDVSMAYGIH